MVSPHHNARSPEWKASAIRIFGLTALILGCGSAFLCLVVLESPSYRSWSMGLPLLGSLLGLWLAANLIYVGWHTISRGTIPIRPRPLRWPDLGRFPLVSLNPSAILVCTVALFAVCAAMGAYFMISLVQLASDFHAGRTSNFEFYQIILARILNTSPRSGWLIWAVHFPASMSVAIVTGIALGVIRRRRPIEVAAAIGLLFLTGPAVLVFCVLLLIILWLSGLIALWSVAYLSVILVGALFLSLSHAALTRGPEFDVEPPPSKHWSSHFPRTILIVGLPGGFILGIILAKLLNQNYWILGGIEITCAALYGASLVHTDRRASAPIIQSSLPQA